MKLPMIKSQDYKTAGKYKSEGKAIFVPRKNGYLPNTMDFVIVSPVIVYYGEVI